MVMFSNSNPVIYAGDGAKTTFPHPWYLLDTSHLIVQIISNDGTESIPALGVDFTVAPAPPALGGTITFLSHAIPQSGENVMLARRLLPEQPTSLPVTSYIDLPTIELALDRLSMVDDTQEEALSRRPAFRFSSLNNIRNMVIPQPVALKLLQFNATADGLSLVDPAIITATPSAVSQLVYTQGSVSVTPDASDIEEVASAFVPAGIILLGVVAYVLTTLGDANGLTTWSLGTNANRSKWGSGHARTALTQTNAGQFLGYQGGEPVPTALDVVLTADAGAFEDGEVILTYTGFAISPAVSV
jgi:hypothetical protein